MGAGNSKAYDLSLFEPPRVEPVKKAPQQTKKVKKKQKKKQSYLESKGVAITASRKTKQVTVNRTLVVQVLAPLLICMVGLPMLLFAKADINELDKQIAAVETQIDIQEGEAVRLNAELSGLISSARIEEIAENELGMVKAEGYQITYIDLSEGDEIVVSGDKVPGESGNFFKRLEKMVAQWSK